MSTGLDRFRGKLARAYALVARQVGKPYSVYRPTTMQNILDTSNFIGTVPCSFTLDDSYSNVQGEGYAQYKAFCDWSKVQVGDVLNDGQETFVITWNRGADMTMAIKADHLIEVWRPEWTTTGGLSQSPVRWARNVPASFQSTGSQLDVAVPRVAQSAQAATWEVRIWTDAENIDTSDLIIREDGLRLQITSIKNNKHCQILTCSSVDKETP